MDVHGRVGIITPCLYFFAAFLPLIMSITQNTNYEKGFTIVVFSVYTFMMGLMRVGKKHSIQLHQIKIYPLSGQLIVRLLWVIELLDYTFLMFLVSAIGGILILYPDSYLTALFLVCLCLSYALIALLVSEIKLLISHYRPAGSVVALFSVGLYLTSLRISGAEQHELTFIYEFVSNWRTQILFFGIFVVVLAFLYKIGIRMVSNIRMISK